MALYKAARSGAAPLLIEVRNTSSGMVEVLGMSAAGESTSGSASRPVLYRPSSGGSGSGSAVCLSGSTTAASTVITSFTANPSLPAVTSGSFNLPIRVRWVSTPGNGMILDLSASVVLYAVGNSGHTWNGEILFEER